MTSISYFLFFFFSAINDICGGLLFNSSGTLQKLKNKVYQKHFIIYLCFFLRLQGGCNNDYIEIYDGPPKTSPLLGRICSNSHLTYTSSSNFMTVRFHSDSRYSNRGFHAHYSSIPEDHNTKKNPMFASIKNFND
uniref:CUB domain-containing protein n=1 Tax=Otus sunia TaxID=257818 RepID=A0A8C8AB31_9STRI